MLFDLFFMQGIQTLMYHSGLTKTSEASIDRAGSREALKCLANALLLKPTTRPIFERLEGHGQCSQLLKVTQLYQLARRDFILGRRWPVELES